MSMVEAPDFSQGNGALGRREKTGPENIGGFSPGALLPRICASIDSLADRAYTLVSFLQARAAGKAVQIGRGPATVIG
jgi:hypothetical protein